MKRDNIIERFQSLTEKVNKYSNSLARLEGEENAVLKRLKDFGVKDIEDGEEEYNALVKEKESIGKQLDNLLTRIEKEM